MAKIMIITYFRSSSYNRWDFCQSCYFYEYVLGLKSQSNKAADKGTIVHKIMELLAWAKKTNQDGKKSYKDDETGLTVPADYNSIDVSELIEKVYKYYTSNIKHHDWKDADFKDCKKWTIAGLTHENGAFDPRLRTIVEPELHFDFEINEPWAKYEYEVDGEIITGNLAIKGTIDLITDCGNNTYELVDWKTGARKDWATGEAKDYAKLMKDPQLRLYYYAIKTLFPDKDILFTIFFIKDGGPFTLGYSDSDIVEIKEQLKHRFNIIKRSMIPNKIDQSQKWKCKRLCHFGKNTFVGTDITPMQEFRRGQVCKQGETMTMCEQIHYDLKKLGHEKTVRKYKDKDFSVGKYHAPGQAN